MAYALRDGSLNFMGRYYLCVDTSLKKKYHISGNKINLHEDAPLNAWKHLWSEDEALQIEMHTITYNVFNMEMITSPLSYTHNALAICRSI